MWIKLTIPLLVFLVIFTLSAEAQQRRVRLRARPAPQEVVEEDVSEERPQIVQYYRPQAKQDTSQEELVYINDDEYQGLYGPSTPAARPRDYRPVGTTVRPLASRTQTLAPRSKETETKAPPVQTIRNFNKVNDDGSYTFGYEAADGSFKEETRGVDCVVRGKYGYIEPDTGNKREFTYVSGNPCDPNNPDGEEQEERNQSAEDSEENVPQNYPKRPAVPIARPRPTQQATTRAPTTVFQNRYNVESEEDDSIYANIPKTTARPAYVQQQQQQQQPTQRPRVQIIHTTAAPPPVNYSPTPAVNITPKPLYRINTNTNSVLSIQQPQPPATTYRPQTASHFITQKPVHVTASSFTTKGASSNFGSSTRGSIDFDAEFKKFQRENNFQTVTAAPGSQQPSKGIKLSQNPSVTTGNPIYQSQLVYNPATGQYDSNLYQSIGSEGDFQLNQRIQPYQQQYQIPQQQQQQHEQRPQFSLQNSPLYRPVPQNVQSQQQVPQQIYQKQQNEMQFVNSQQLFAQQLEMQQNQLHRDRIEAAKKHTVSPAHRFQLQQQQQAQQAQQQQFGVQPLRAQAPQQQQQQQAAAQQFYYLQPNAQQSSGQIDAFLRGHNLEY